jgi:menaquinone-dependent protoporphyrinogen oxidase
MGETKMQNKKILVTYASRAGSTAGIAEAIGRNLTEAGALVDVMPMQEVQDLSAYQAVVAGSAIRGSKWLPEAVQFIRTHQEELGQKRFALFTVCITMAMKNAENYRGGVAGWVAPVRALVKPLSEGFFAGVLDFSKLPVNWDTLMLRLSVALGIFPRGDHRNWDSIDAWAKALKPVLLA